MKIQKYNEIESHTPVTDSYHQRGVYVSPLREEVVNSPAAVYYALQEGESMTKFRA